MAASANELDVLSGMLKQFTGSTRKTSGGTETSSTSVSQQGLADLLRQSLQSHQGLAAVSQGQRSAGLYNSSTNRLLVNDLMSRLAGEAASRTSTKTMSRTPLLEKSGGNDALGKVLLGLTAAQKLGVIGNNKGPLSGVADSAVSGAQSLFNSIFSSPEAPAFFDAAGPSNFSEALNPAQTDLGTFISSIMNSGQSLDLGGLSGAYTNNAADADAFIAAMGQSGDTAANFSQAPAATTTPPTQTLTGTNGTDAAGAATSASANLNLSGVGPSVMGLYSGIGQLTDSQHENDVAGAMNAASGAYGGYKTYQAYQAYQAAQAAKAAAAAAAAADAANTASAASSAGDAATAADSASTASSASSGMSASTFGGGAGTGSALGYVGPVLNAIFAPDNPKGEGEKDYRKAVGGAILNYFGFGWATPIVDEVARPVLDNAMSKGEESGGLAGAFVADPIGAFISGQYDTSDMLTAVSDPANITGGNPGGSTGALAAYGIDPLGGALGDEGVYSVVRDTVDSAEQSDPLGNAVGSLLGQGDSGGGLPGIGKVICTEMHSQDRISDDLYSIAISPKYIMRGRVLTGYHVWGVAAVRLLRKNAKFSEWLAPYVIKYLEHKSGKRPNWTGFWIKNIMHPICWMLSFFNTNPDAYKTLYRRERKLV